MSDEIQLLSATVRRILDETAMPSDIRQVSAAWKVFEEAGLSRVELPEEAGGGGGRLSQAAAIVRTAAEFCPSIPLGETLLVASWLLHIAEIAVPAGPLSYGTGGSLEVSRESDSWRVEGVIPRVPYGRIASSVAVLARSADGPLVLLIDAGQTKIDPGENFAGEPRDDLFLSRMLLPRRRVGSVSEAVAEEFDQRRQLLRLLLMAGVAIKTLELTVRHTSDRKQFGRPLISFQAVQQGVAQMANEVTALSVAAEAATRELEQHGDAALLIEASRLYAVSSARQIAQVAHQLHGAIGTTLEHELHLYTQRLLAWRLEDGSEKEFSERLLSRTVLTGMDLWAALTGYEIGAQE